MDIVEEGDFSAPSGEEEEFPEDDQNQAQKGTHLFAPEQFHKQMKQTYNKWGHLQSF